MRDHGAAQQVDCDDEDDLKRPVRDPIAYECRNDKRQTAHHVNEGDAVETV